MIVEYKNLDWDFIEEKIDFDIKFEDSIKLKNVCFSYKKKQLSKI